MHRILLALQAAGGSQSQFYAEMRHNIAGYDIGHAYGAGGYIGGDFLDVFHIAENRIGFLLGDVSGRGVHSALVASWVHGRLRSALELGLEPNAALAHARVFPSVNASDYFTCFCAILDTLHHEIIYSSGGHVPGFHFSASSNIARLGPSSPPIFSFPLGELRQATFALEPGGIVVICSDGLTEACDPEGNEFGEERLQEGVRSVRACNAQRIADELVRQVRAYAQVTTPQDDQAILIIKRRQDESI